MGLTRAQAGDTVVDLSTWQAEGTGGVWNVAGDKLSVLQTINGDPAFFYSDFDVIGMTMQGQIKVETSGDDDFVGFALGFQPGDLTDQNADYLLVDWKQGTQYWSPFGGYGHRGLAVSRVTGVPTLAEWWRHVNSGGGSGLQQLQRGATRGSTGWSDYATYYFRFEMTSTSLKVFMNGTKEIDITGTFSDGRLAFYNFSQAAVRYSGFERNRIPVADDESFVMNEDDTLNFTLDDLLDGDTDPDGDDLTAAITGPPAHGGYSVISGNVTYTPDPDFFGTDTMTYTASDEDGASDTGTITITVNGLPDPPVAICKPATIYLDANGVAHLDPSDIDGGSYDPDGEPILLSCQGIFTAEDLGSQAVALIVTNDPEGIDRSQCSALVTVVDEIPPSITAPDDVEVEGTSPAGVPSAEVDLGAAVASDNDEVNEVTVTNDAPPVFGFASPTVVIWTATDGSGNTATDTQTITVVDTTPPVITLNGDAVMTLELGGDPYAEPGAEATDICDPDVLVVIGGDTVDTGTKGTYVVTYNATDKFENDAVEVTRTVHVLDSTPPDIEAVTVNSDTLWPPNHKMVPITVTVVASDNVDGANITTEIISVVSSEPDDGLGDGKTGPDVEIIAGTMTVNLRAERSGGGVGRVYTITVQCTDQTGNSSTAEVTVTVPHDQGNDQESEEEPAEEPSNGGGNGKGKGKNK